MALKVKICGITAPEALEAATAHGADYVGFVIHPPAPRHLTPAQAALLITRTDAQVASVIVCVDPSDELLEEICRHRPPSYLQLHGEESPQRVEDIKSRYGTPIIKALGVRCEADLEACYHFADSADMLLLDAKTSTPDMPGGMGQAFDWSLLHGFTSALPWFLSGGLNAGNLAEAIHTTGATLVDVSSGVESARGVKDGEKIRAFLKAAQSLDSLSLRGT